MSNRLKSFLIVVVSIVVVMAALPLNALTVNAAEIWTISYDANGGAGTMSDSKVDKDTGTVSITLSNNSFTPPQTSLVFDCWCTSQDGSGQTFNEGHPLDLENNKALFDSNHTLTLYAKWKLDTTNYCKVVYHANYGDSTATHEDVCPKSSVSISDVYNDFTNTNHEFLGWSTTQTGDVDSSYAPGTNIGSTTASEINLYAVWGYAITYDPNQPSNVTATPTGTMTAQTCKPSESVQLNENNYSIEGLTFMGWDTDAGGTGTHYEDKQSNVTFDENTTLFAQWGYTVTFNANTPAGATDPTTTMDPQTAKLGESVDLTANSFAITDYTFKGWNTAANGSGDPYSDGATVTFDKDTTLYAQWGHTITFNANAPDGATAPTTTMAPQIVDHNVAEALNINEYVISGYRFLGWNTNPTGGTSGNFYTDKQSVTFLTNTTLHAQWQKYWTVSYDANGGSGTIASVNVDDGSFTTAANPTGNITRDGYVFTKWKTDGGDVYAVGATITPTADITLKAQWDRTITFHDNDGVDPDNTAKQSIPVGESADLTNVTFTAPTGKEFYGWATTATGKAIEYTNGQNVTISGNNANDIHDLYALWATPVRITFDKNDAALYESATGLMSEFNAGAEIQNTLPANGYSFTGYTFSGWKVADGVNGVTIYKNGDNYILTIDQSQFTGNELTLYAQWTAIDYTITFNDYDNTLIDSSPVAYGTVPTHTNPVRQQTKELTYTFEGWSANGTLIPVGTALPVVTGAATYTASYSSENRQYNVTASVSGETAGGEVTVSGSNRYSETATITADVYTGYHVEKWINNSVDIDNTDSTYSFTVAGDHAVSVVLAKNPHTVTVSESVGGTAEGTASYLFGDTAEVKATAETGYYFVNWTDENGKEVSKNATYSFTVGDEDYKYKANFKIYEYEIAVSSDGHGTVSGEGTYEHFEEVTVAATESTGYHFYNWTENGSEVSRSAEYSFEVDGARNLVANFEINKYTISVTAGKNGSVSGNNTYDHGMIATVKAVPDTGYHFVNWTENGKEVSTSEMYSFEATSPRSLEANFAINYYTVEFVNDDGTVLQSSEVPYGSNAYYQQKALPTKAPTAQFTYTFAGWDNRTTLVTDDVTYTATYSYTINKYKVTFCNEDGSVLQTGELEYGKMPVFEKDTPTKASTVEETFTFAGWDKEIVKVTGETVYTATYTSKAITKDDINYKHFTVTFNSNGGSEVVSQLVAEGGVAFKPEEPMRERYTFGGWYIDVDLTKPFSFATVITSDITLYAKWIKGSQEVEATYAVVGSGSLAWSLGSTDDLEVKVERSKENDTLATHFKGVQIDGVEIEYYNYEVGADNVVIVRVDALSGLATGKHTITVRFDDGKAEVELVVSDANKPAETLGTTEETAETTSGEIVNLTTEKNTNYLGLWIALAIVAGVVICVFPIFIIKRRSIK